MFVILRIEAEIEGSHQTIQVDYDPNCLLDAVKAWDTDDAYAPAALITFLG
jgi:hypothetical protein